MESRRAVSSSKKSMVAIETGRQELTELLGPKVFTNPKPTRLLRHLLNVGLSDPDDLVLDFFAGSGSIGHALVDYNADNGTACRYVMVQLPERTEGLDDRYSTLSAITRERMRVVGLSRGDHQPALDGTPLDLGFRAFRLSSSNFRVWRPTTQTRSRIN